jgi:hypothetical protein
MRRVVEAPAEIKQQVYQEELRSAQSRGEDTSGLPIEADEEVDNIFNNILAEQGQTTPTFFPEGQRLSAQDERSRKAMSAPDVLVGKYRAREEFSEKRRDDFINKAFEASDIADQTSGMWDVIKSNLDSMVSRGEATGPLSPVISTLNDLGAQVGLKTNLDLSSNLTQIEGFSNALAIPMTKKLGVNPTDRDFSIVKSTLARAGTSVQANYAFYDIAKQLAARQKKFSDLVNEAQSRGVDEEGLRKLKSEFGKESHVVAPVSMPKNIKDLQVGGRYVNHVPGNLRASGIFTYKGQVDEAGNPMLEKVY